MSRKEPGCCSLCDKPVFEVLEKWRFQEGHPLHGRTRRISGTLTDPYAKRVSLLQLGSPENFAGGEFAKMGSQIDLTLCGECKITPQNLPGLWRKCMEAYAEHLEPWFLEAIGKPAPTKEQMEAAERFALWLIANPPIGVLHEQKWTEVGKEN